MNDLGADRWRFNQEKGRFDPPGLANKAWITQLVRCDPLSAALMKKKKVLRFGLPKGSLQDATIEKMAKAGYNISVSSRSYIPYVDDDELEIRMIRAQEISR